MGRRIRIAARVLGIALSVAAVSLSASQALGGPVSVVMVSGSSMQPYYRQGDLVLVRRAGTYEPGDVVAYRSRQLHAVVLHRIVARDGAGFVFQGDNNGWRDPERPQTADLLGTDWIRLPKVGLLLGLFRTRPGMLAGIGVAALISVGGLGVRRRRLGVRRPSVRRQPDGESTVTGVSQPRQSRQAAQVALAVVASISMFTAAAATFRARSATSTVAYEHAGGFEYAASVPADGAYQKKKLETGDPVYLKVAKKVVVAFRYRFQTDASHSLAGHSRLMVEVTDDTGWKHALEIQPETSFAGDKTLLRGELDLERVWSVIDRFQRLTGLQNASYTLTLVPTVRVDGTIGGQTFDDTFDARLPLRLDRLLLRFASPAVAPVDSEASDPLHPRSPGTLDIPSGSRSMFGLPFDPSALRWIALIVGFLSLAGIALTTARPRRTSQGDDEAARILRRYRQWIVPVRGPLAGGDATMIEVTSIEGLLRLADRHGRMVLHDEQDSRHAFLVEDEGTLYRYRPKTSPSEEPDPHSELTAGQASDPKQVPAARKDVRHA